MARRKRNHDAFRAKLIATYDQARALGLRWQTGRVRHHDYEAAMVALDVWQSTGVFMHPTLRLEPPVGDRSMHYMSIDIGIGTQEMLVEPLTKRRRMGWITDDRGLDATSITSHFERASTRSVLGLQKAGSCALVGVVGGIHAGGPPGAWLREVEVDVDGDVHAPLARRRGRCAVPAKPWQRGEHQPRYADTVSAYAGIVASYYGSWTRPPFSHYGVSVVEPLLVAPYDPDAVLTMTNHRRERVPGWFVWVRLPNELCPMCWRRLYASEPMLERCGLCEDGPSALSRHIEEIVRVGRFVGDIRFGEPQAHCVVRAVLADGQIEMEHEATRERFHVGCGLFSVVGNQRAVIEHPFVPAPRDLAGPDPSPS